MSKFSHLRGYHGETFAVLPRTCRFNRSIKGKQIGLKGYIVHQSDDALNFFGTFHNLLHCFNHTLISVLKILQHFLVNYDGIIYRIKQLGSAINHCLLCFLSDFIRVFRVFSAVLDNTVNLFH